VVREAIVDGLNSVSAVAEFCATATLKTTIVRGAMNQMTAAENPTLQDQTWLLSLRHFCSNVAAVASQTAVQQAAASLALCPAHCFHHTK
jgi:hypothetical protein